MRVCLLSSVCIYVYLTGCISVEPSGNGSEYLRCFVDRGCDWLSAVQSDAQVFGVILVGLLGLRERWLG